MNCGTPFCHAGVVWQGVKSGCPLYNLIPEWNDLVCGEHFMEAWERLKATSPFPEFTSRVCPALCEGACTLGLHDEPASIRELERFISDKGFEMGWEKPVPPEKRTNRRVAVVGSGPAGLAVAWALNRAGVNVDVYEKADRAGGLLMYGIPPMKLPKPVVERRVKMLEEEGVNFHLNSDITADNLSESILKTHDAVVLCCGAGVARNLTVPGRELDGIEYAVPFLTVCVKNVLNGKTDQSLKGKHVVIIGGGDTGNDCVAASIRLGAASVTQLEIMPELPAKRDEDNPWPRWPFILKTDYGQKEAISIFGSDPREYCVSTISFDGEGKVVSLTAVKVEWVADGARRKPVPIEGTEKVIPADLVLIAMGFIGANKEIFTKFNIEQTSLRNPKEEVFIAGDMRTGQSLVVKAIADGLQTAREVLKYLNAKEG